MTPGLHASMWLFKSEPPRRECVSVRMAESVSKLKAARGATSLAKSLAPEDVRVGDFVAPLHETYDCPSFLWCDAGLTDRAETVPIRLVAQDAGAPLKVQAVCLPYVLVKHPLRGSFPLDVRTHQLAKLDRTYAKLAWKALKPSASKSKRKQRKKKSK